MQLETVKFLSKFEDPIEALKAIEEKYGIHSIPHEKYPNIVQLKYDQVKSPEAHPIVRECRGLILDYNENWEIKAYPFRRFYNYGSHHADGIDWKSATIWDKVDGSLMFMYELYGEWEIASSGMPDARGQVGHNDFSMKELFLKTWKELGYEMPDIKYKYTYIFEMATPENVVIVPHKDSRIVFIGARCHNDFNEHSIDPIPNKWERPEKYDVRSEEDAYRMCEQMNPMEKEGFVIVDRNFNRVKMKSPQYAAIGHLGLTKEEVVKKGLDPKKVDERTQKKWMLKIVLTNECDEFLTYYPQYKSLYDEIDAKFTKFMSEAQALYDDAIATTNNHFEFATKVKGHPLNGVLFKLKDGVFESLKSAIIEITQNRSGIKRVLKEVLKINI